MVDLQDHPADVNFDMGQPIELSDAYVSDIEFDQSLIPILSEGFLQADDIINQQPIKFNSFNQRQIMSQMNLRNNKDPNKLGQPIKIQDLESIEPITIIPDLTYTGMQGLNISPLKNILGPLNQSGFNDTTDNDLFNDDVPDNDLFTEDDVLDEDELSSLFETFSNHLSSGFNLNDHMGATNDPKNINNDVLNNAISSQFCHYIQLSNNQNNNNNNKLSSLDSSSNSNNTILSTNDEEEDEAHKYYSGNVSHNNNSFNTSANNSCNSANASLNNSALSLHCAKIKDDFSNIINNNKNNLINNKNNNNTSNNNNKTQVIRNLKIHMDSKTFTQTKGTTYKKKYILSNRGVGALVCISPSDDGPANTTTPQHTNKQQHLKNIKAPRQHLQQMLCNKQPQHFKHSETKQHVVTPQQPHHFPKDFHHIPLSSTPKTHKFSEPSLIHNYKQKNNNNSNNKNNEINNGHIKAGSDVSHKHHREVFRDRLCNIPSYNNNNTNNNNSNTNNNNNINRNSNNVLRLTTNNRANILNNINNKKNIFQHHPIHHNNNNNNNTNYHNNNNNTNYINNNKNNRISLSPTNHPKPPTTHLSTRGKQMGSEAKGHEDNKNNKDSLPNILKRKQRNCTKTTFTPSKFLNHPNNTTPVSKRIKNNSLSNQFDSLLIHLPCKKQIFPDDDRNNKNNNIFGSINNNNNNKDNFVVNNNNNNFVVNNNSNTNNPLSVNTSNNSSDLLVANKNNISANNSTSTIKDDVSNDVTAFIITKNFKNKKNILNSSRKGKKNSKLNSSHLSPSTQLLLECSNNDQSLICIETPSKILSDDDDDILNFKLNTCTPGNNNNNNNNKNNNDNNTNVDDEDVDKDMVALDDVRENGGQTVSGGGDARQNLFKSKSIDASDEDRNADDGDKKERVGKVQRCVSYTEGSKDEAFLKVACCDNSHLQQLLKQARDVLNNNNKKKEQ